MSTEVKATFLSHIYELKRHLQRGVIAVVITTALSFIFADRIFQILIRPVQGYQLIYVEVTEMISIYMKVCLLTGIILAMPFLVYELLSFINPGLTLKEKKYVYIALPWMTAMFIGGVLFAYFMLVPPAMNFLLNFGNGIATPQIRIGNYIDLVSKLLLAIGLVFELPVVTTFLANLGIITSDWLARKRKIAVISAFVIAALITPTVDPINQSLVAGPLIVLYEMSIWLAKVFQKRRRTESITEPATSIAL